MNNIPLFPLKTVLLPGNDLSLKIFEPRYVDMIADCMRNNGHFGVVLIHEGEEVGHEADIHAVGTSAVISDWQDRSDGLLGITASGQQRFEILSTEVKADGLCCAEVSFLEEETSLDIPDQYQYLSELLTHITQQQNETVRPDAHFADVLYRLIYLLPLDNHLKQRLLEVPEAIDRAGILHAELIRLGVIQYVDPDSTTVKAVKSRPNKGH